MEFTCSRQAFLEALSLVGNIVPTRSTKPALQNIHFKAQEGNRLELTATDLELGVRYLLDVDELKDPEEVLLPANRLVSVIREAWGENITLQIKDCKADIITEGGKFHVLGEQAEEFPAIPAMDEGASVGILAADMVQAIQRTGFSTAREEERYALAGINMVMEGEQVEMVTTDTFRLSLSRKPLRNAVSERIQAIVPVKAMNELSKLIQNEELLKIQISDNQFFASTERAVLVSRLIEGKFPQYQNIMPDGLDRQITVKRDRFMQALRQAATLSNEETRAVNLVTQGDVLEIRASAADGSTADVKIEATVSGGDVSVNFNYVYLMDVCKVLAEEEITLQLRDRESPGRIDYPDYTYVVSPVCPRGN